MPTDSHRATCEASAIVAGQSVLSCWTVWGGYVPCSELDGMHGIDGMESNRRTAERMMSDQRIAEHVPYDNILSQCVGPLVCKRFSMEIW